MLGKLSGRGPTVLRYSFYFPYLPKLVGADFHNVRLWRALRR
jgi:hypothetical protein